MKNISTGKKIKLAEEAALAKKAKDVALLDLRKLPAIADYFILASGDSITQVTTIADNIEAELSRRGCRAWHREGSGEARWILLDYGDIVVHVFHKETRSFYDLDRLWRDSPRRNLGDAPAKKSARRLAQKKSKKRRSSG